MGKDAFIKRMVAVRNYSTNTNGKKQTEGEGGMIKDKESSGVK